MLSQILSLPRPPTTDLQGLGADSLQLDQEGDGTFYLGKNRRKTKRHKRKQGNLETRCISLWSVILSPGQDGAPQLSGGVHLPSHTVSSLENQISILSSEHKVPGSASWPYYITQTGLGGEGSVFNKSGSADWPRSEIALFTAGNRDWTSTNFLCFPKKRENVAATNQMYRISLEMMLTSEVSYCGYCA